MSWSWTLYRYLAVQFFLGVAVVYAGFLALAFSIHPKFLDMNLGRQPV